MRQFHQVVIALFLISAAGAQTVHIDESASQVKLQGKTYEVSLGARSTPQSPEQRLWKSLRPITACLHLLMFHCGSRRESAGSLERSRYRNYQSNKTIFSGTGSDTRSVQLMRSQFEVFCRCSKPLRLST